MSIRLLMRPLLALSLGALLVLGGCVAQPETRLSYTKLDFAALPGWGTDDLQGLGVAWRASCKAKPDARWRAFCAGLPAADGALRAYIEQNLTPWQLVTPSGDTGLFTGYYAPDFKASLTRQGVYQTPIYAMPSDLAIADLGAFKPELRGQQITGRVERGRFVPYPDRAAITQQALAAADKATTQHQSFQQQQNDTAAQIQTLTEQTHALQTAEQAQQASAHDISQRRGIHPLRRILQRGGHRAIHGGGQRIFLVGAVDMDFEDAVLFDSRNMLAHHFILSPAVSPYPVGRWDGLRLSFSLTRA